MEAQSLLQFKHLSAAPLNPLRDNILAATRKSPAHIRNSRNRLVFATLNSTTSVPKREKDPKKRVVVTGMGVASVFGNDVDMFYEKLLAGESGIGLIDRFDTTGYTTRFAGQIRGFSSEGYVDPKYEKKYDNSQKYCLVAGKKAVENAGLDVHARSKIDKDRAGVLVGSGIGGITIFENAVETLVKEGCRKVNPYAAALVVTSMGSALLSIDLGFMGPNYGVAASCASSNACFCAAATHIREGEADVMVVGGAEALITPLGMASFGTCKALSTRNDDPKGASRPWNKGRDGFIMGEGGAVLVMESLEHAMKRDAPIFAEFLGGSLKCDAYHITNPRLDGFGLSNCIQSCLDKVGVSTEEVNYINAHATSTIKGDMCEYTAIKNVFKNTEGIKMNATKSMIGHAMGAAGGLEAIVIVKAIQTGWLHPTLNQYDPEPGLDIDTVPNVKQQHEINVAISDSFGLGGHNAVVAFSPFRP
ncbi:3-oxoacyl-[acyl-carrier-protein] synthase I, chloroplastic-like [Rutidosis leptorrhynchoides]|uniref:3-oxoacyl-[acyl-carrier-protein] synthase I, chloroplastic-like n=1 Tax=Rutidosis leptorrhynchoides TaxID=125765 RepID=UPI003A98DDC2